MPRPVWSGTITFGLVNIPVKIYNTVKKTSLHFHQLRKSDGCRIQYKKVCASDGDELSNEEIVRGIEISPERYIVVSEEELEAIYPQATRSIEIEDFTKLQEIDPIYYDQSYYLVPDKGAAKSYALLRQAMENTGKVGIARFVLRNKEYLGAVRPFRRVLGLSAMLFHEEIVDAESFENLPDSPIDLDPRELAMAKKLIDSLAADFQPEKYRDSYRQQVMNLIESKADDQHVVTRSAAAEPKTKVIDIMAALEASLASAKKSSPVKSRKKKLTK